MLRVLVALVLLFPAPVVAQFVRGIIVDPATGARIPSVSVRVLDREGRPLYSIVAEPAGDFMLPVRAGREVSVEFQSLGYIPVRSKSFTLGPAQLLELEVHMQETSVRLRPIVVIGKRRTDSRLEEFYERALLNRKLGVGRIWTREELEAHPPTRMSHLLATVPARGGGSCTRDEVFLDGMPLSMNPGHDITSGFRAAHGRPPAGEGDVDPSVVDWLVWPENVEGVEVYRGAEIPARYADPDLCRVTLIWRKQPIAEDRVDFGMARNGLAVVALGLAIGWLVFRLH